MKRITITYTADVIRPDDTDTNVYGDPCEPGYGQVLESGWWDPEWSPWVVSEDQDDAAKDVIDLQDPDDAEELADEWGGDLEKMILARIADRIGSIDCWDGRSAYAADAITNYRTGEQTLAAAHVTYEDVGILGYRVKPLPLVELDT